MRAAVAATAALALAGLYLLPLLAVSANRLAIGEPVYAGEAFGPEIDVAAALVLAGSLLLAGGGSRVAAACAGLLLATATMVLGFGLCTAAIDLDAGRPAAARVALAAGAWTALAALSGALVLAGRRAGCRRPGMILLAGFAVAIVAAGRAGLLDGVSLMEEFRARQATLRSALIEHLLLAGGALALAVVAVLLSSPWRRLRAGVDLLAGGVQVVPAVALLAAMTALVSALLKAFPALREAGLSALGPVPALLAVAAYLILPLWRGLAAALRAPDPAVLDAARALGLSPRETLVQVRLPIGAPALIGALRVASVQAIGLATLGALVGAGGLGRIVFDGMAQFAPDLILLGAMPVVGLSLAVEGVLSALEDRVRRWV
ncbi:ABC transporter permease [Methylobacterium sp. sgz302541]|uniref:ABC transporter permease n=1 Tax=unclassified Methylobacterium TaxID=2615210 RepID=UPI003D334A74